MITYDVGEQWSKYPGGRKIAHGPASGEQFLLQVLVPFWETYDANEERIRLDFEGCVGTTVGFLDESFGELAVLFGKEAVLKRFSIVGKSTVEDEIDGVLSRADKTGKYKTPELDKIRATEPQRRTIQNFFEWCEEQKPSLHLARHDPDDRRGFMVNDVRWQDYCTKWLGIDESKAEQERELILSQIREKNALFERSAAYRKRHGVKAR